MPAIAVIRIKLIFNIIKIKIKKFKVKFFFLIIYRLSLMGLDTPVIKWMSR